MEKLQTRLTNGTFAFSVENEDIHLNIEKCLHEEIGPVAGKLHTARSRNDQVATDMHLYLKDTVLELIEKLHSLRQTFVEKAAEHYGYDHARIYSSATRPTDFLGHHLLAYYQMLTRDHERFTESLETNRYFPH